MKDLIAYILGVPLLRRVSSVGYQQSRNVHFTAVPSLTNQRNR